MTGARQAAVGPQRFERDRRRMVEERLAGRGITDARVLEAMSRVPRHLFVEEALQDRAYGEHPLPIGDGQTISQPLTVARVVELLRLTGREKVLEVGSGSGYQAAVLGELAGRVCTVERIPRLAGRARQMLEELGYRNVWVRAANGAYGWPDEAPFDRIVVAAAGPAIPAPLLDQLGEGGRLVMPVSGAHGQRLTLVEKVGGRTRSSDHSACSFVRLVGAVAGQA